MKNPIRAWIAKIAREEIYAERRERNLEAIRDIMARPLFMAELDAGREAIKRRREAKS